MRPQSIHYLWIGPPASKSSGVIGGQDVLGPKMFTGDHCNFWCLEGYAAYYTEALAGKKNITVRSIQSYLLDCMATDSKMADTAKTALEFFAKLLAPERNKVCDRVVLKELMAYFLLYAQGGYVADSNVIFDDPVKLVSFDKLCCPHYGGKLTKSHVDIWLLYSPKGFERTGKSLNAFIAAHQLREGKVRHDSPTSEYHRQIPIIALGEALLLESDRSPDPSQLGFWRVEATDRNKSVISCSKLSVRKLHFNTHVYQATTDHVFVLLQANDLSLLAFMLEHGEEINQTFNPPRTALENVSLLHWAILCKNVEAVNLLLLYHPDCTKLAFYIVEGRDLSTEALADMLAALPGADLESRAKYKACKDIIKAHIAKSRESRSDATSRHRLIAPPPASLPAGYAVGGDDETVKQLSRLG
ncbi:MAG: hypothetical protein P1U34_06765 [Coxiellaceae bacterium]|nr:hypothetical protein [Coxiellaceae bacterium]